MDIEILTTVSAFRALHYGEVNAGIILFTDRIRSVIACRFTACDFLRGNEPYKYRCGATDRPLSQLLALTACPVPGSCL